MAGAPAYGGVVGFRHANIETIQGENRRPPGSGRRSAAARRARRSSAASSQAARRRSARAAGAGCDGSRSSASSSTPCSPVVGRGMRASSPGPARRPAAALLSHGRRPRRQARGRRRRRAMPDRRGRPAGHGSVPRTRRTLRGTTVSKTVPFIWRRTSAATWRRQAGAAVVHREQDAVDLESRVQALTDEADGIHKLAQALQGVILGLDRDQHPIRRRQGRSR